LLQDAREPTAPPQRLWDLNQGLPPELQGAVLLGSSFALQWLEQPQRALQLWCEALAPGGVLALAVPCAGSFGLWHQACQRAEVPFTGLQLPQADALISLAGSRLRLRRAERLQFSRPNRGALAFLRQFKAIGAQASRGPRLSRGQLRRLEQHWPAEAAHVGWEVLVIVGQSAP
jgi:malonyl-CoA O-methyltransferase